MYVHRQNYIMRGRGLGNIFSSLFKKVIPIAKSFGKSLIKSPVAKHIGKTAKRTLTDSALNLAADAISGDVDMKESFQKNLSSARQNLGKSIKNSNRFSNTKKQKVYNKKKAKMKKSSLSKKGIDLFDD